MTDKLHIWTIYDHPIDYPRVFVARRFRIEEEPVATNEAYYCEDLSPLREVMRRAGLTCIPRSPTDDPVIVESWL